MKDNALSVANHLVGLSLRDSMPLRPLGLMKRVYIAHGFSLAFYHRSLLDPRFDRVEAWRYGPVVPSVYQSFKMFGNHAITEKTGVFTGLDDSSGDVSLAIPELENAESRAVVEMVWKRYMSQTDGQLVRLTHQRGTPWYVCYAEGENRVIPDEITEMYYAHVMNNIQRIARDERRQ